MSDSAIPEASPPRALYTTKEFALMCGVTNKTVIRWCDSGDIDAVSIAGTWRIPARTVTSFLGGEVA